MSRTKTEKKDLDRATFQLRAVETRKHLLDAQYALLEAKKKTVLVLVNGFAASGRGETVNLLGEWMDPRHLRTYAFGAPIEEENELPETWRFFRDLPKRGQVGIFFSNWYEPRFAAAAKGKKIDASGVLAFESMLVHNGVHLVKLFFDLDAKAQKKRLEELESDKDTRWRVTKEDWKANQHHDKIRRGAQKLVAATSTPRAPWQIVDGSRPRAAGLEVGRILAAAMNAALAPEKAEKKAKLPAPLPKARLVKTPDLTSLDFSPTLEDDAYEERLEHAQRRLAMATRHKKFPHHGVAVVFEGADAAGKGGAIRRITRALDARVYEVVPIAAPTEEDRAYPYLWRFYKRLPRHGRLTVFDRSWYGRLLVERVEGFATEAEIARSYGEIVRFEDEIHERGSAVVKFWLAIDKDEQKRRFAEREATDFKRYKITAEDWRNREKWDDYLAAANDMFARTSTKEAPWKVVAANDKRFARVTVIEHLADRIEHLLG